MNAKRIVLMLLVICMILSSCTNTAIDKKNLDETEKLLDTDLLLDKILSQRLHDGSFCAMADEYEIDIYSTYYSVQSLDELGVSYIAPAYMKNFWDRRNKITLSDVYQYTYLFNEKIINDKTQIDTICSILEEYKINNHLFAPESTYKSDDVADDSIILLYTFFALSIYRELEIKYDYQYYVTFYEECLQKCENNTSIIEKYDTLSILLNIAKLLEVDEKPIQKVIANEISLYENELRKIISDDYGIFALNSYLDILNGTDLPYGFTESETQTIIDKHSSTMGGYATSNDDKPNPLPTYLIIKLCKCADLDINFDSTIEVINRHQRTDGYFIIYTIFEADIASTYYAYSIMKYLSTQEEYKPPQNYSIVVEEPFLTLINSVNGGKIESSSLIETYEAALYNQEDVSYTILNRIRLLLELCRSNGVDLPENDIVYTKDMVLKFIEEIDEQTDKWHSVNEVELCAYSIIALVDSALFDEKAGQIISNFEPENITDAYWLCIIIKYLKMTGIDINSYIKAEQVNQIVKCLSDSIYGKGLVSLDDDNEITSIYFNYMGVVILNTIKELNTNN